MLGVTLLRAAAKNHSRVAILSDPQDYAEFLKELSEGEITEKSRQLYALKAFEHTADYDGAISDFFRKKYAGVCKDICLLPSYLSIGRARLRCKLTRPIQDGVQQLSLRCAPTIVRQRSVFIPLGYANGC